jgi:hypothetical protein
MQRSDDTPNPRQMLIQFLRPSDSALEINVHNTIHELLSYGSSLAESNRYFLRRPSPGVDSL